MLTTLILLSALSTSSWKQENTYLQASMVVVSFVDVLQTRYFLRKPVRCNSRDEGQPDCQLREWNPIFPAYPNAAQLYGYTLIGQVVHLAISVALPEPYRTLWQSSTLTLETMNVARNAYCIGGVRLKF